MGIKASMLVSAYWRRRCPPQLSYHPRCPQSIEETIESSTQAVRLPYRTRVCQLSSSVKLDLYLLVAVIVNITSQTGRRLID